MSGGGGEAPEARALGGSDWQREEYDVDAYLALIGVGRERPGLELLGALHRRHVGTLVFANVDVLLGAHPGVAPATVQRQLVERGRGGYCFEHAQLFAAALEDLGFTVRRHLGRVHSPHNTRTHMTVAVQLDGRWFLTDPGFGFSLTGPIELRDGARRNEGRRNFVIGHSLEDGGDRWTLSRDGQLQHITDTLTVQPIDVRTGHVLTSTNAGSGRFTGSLVAARHTDVGHVTITESTRTVRAPGRRTVHEQITPAQAVDAVQGLGVRLVDDEPARLLRILESWRTAAQPVRPDGGRA
ncbi:arylamine N-acetyltransferase family protein [Arthrobacter sp.]|uniref:arylamine N-acetyltransferase family protein n=1 Tax=Arthrobacter sp. TaxID=1667 RepID=UPI003A941E11